MNYYSHSTNHAWHRLATSFGVLLLAGTVATACGGSEGGAATTAATTVAEPSTTGTPTTAGTPSTSRAPSTTVAVTTNDSGTNDSGSDDSGSDDSGSDDSGSDDSGSDDSGTDESGTDGDGPFSTTPVIAENPAGENAIDWEAEDGKAAMKIDPTWTPTGEAPASGFPLNLEGEWKAGGAIVSVITYDAGDATPGDLGETFWSTHKGTELSTSELVKGPNGNELTFFETASESNHTVGFASIENGTLAVAELTAITEADFEAADQVGPLLFTIMAK